MGDSKHDRTHHPETEQNREVGGQQLQTHAAERYTAMRTNRFNGDETTKNAGAAAGRAAHRKPSRECNAPSGHRQCARLEVGRWPTHRAFILIRHQRIAFTVHVIAPAAGSTRHEIQGPFSSPSAIPDGTVPDPHTRRHCSDPERPRTFPVPSRARSAGEAG